MDKMGEILRQAADHNFHISNIKMVKLSEEQIEDLCKIWENPSVQYVKIFSQLSLKDYYEGCI